MRRERVAVIGAGAAGLTAGYLLAQRYEVLLFDADDRLGGHANTHDVRTPDGRTIGVDSGFIVHNRRTYPNLVRLFGELGVETQETEMSMSVRCDGCGLEYAGARGTRGLFARRSMLASPAYVRMLSEVPRFYRHARRVLADPAAAPAADTATLGGFLAAGGYSRYFVQHFALPLVSAVWSVDHRTGMRYPARYLFTFLHHHGLLSVTGSPTWRTVVGGSRQYTERVVKEFAAVRLDTPVRAVRRHPDGVLLHDAGGHRHEVDRVVIATHADQAMRLLADPTTGERDVLGAFGYSRNETVLHTDPAVLPAAPGAHASWNYRKPACAAGSDRVLVSYHMNRLMRLTEPLDYLVTLNAADRIADEHVLARMVYEHPVYTPESVAAQRRLPELTTTRTAYAGSYHGWGFHEDACASGVRAAEAFGAGWV